MSSQKPICITSSTPISSKLLSSSVCTLFFLFLLCILAFYTLHHPNPSPPVIKSRNAIHFQQFFLSYATNYTFSSYLKSLTLHPHVAGTEQSLETVHYVENHFKELGFDTHRVEFNPLLSYPLKTSISVLYGNGSSKDLILIENGEGGKVIDPYHAYSPSGMVMAKAVFVNFGRDEDYRTLVGLGVNVSGCVVVVRRGEVARGGVVRVAEENGAAAVLLYADGDRFNGVERGTVMRGIGDPLTPGWGGVEGGEKLDLGDNEVLGRFPKIPSLPISVENAEIILRGLGGVKVPSEWRDTLVSDFGRVGVGPILVNFTYKEEKKVAKIHNIFAVIKGWEESDRYVLLGNHRDAWTYGAVDPNSGTAALLDIARRFSLLMRSGWTPRRTIVFCSWDAEEFGMVGSTEWVEQNLVNLGSKAVVYLNVDCAVQGPGFFARATPQLDNLIVEITKKIKDPDAEGRKVYETWKATNGGINIGRLSGVDSDYAPFLQHAGVPSVDMYYGKDFPVYHTAFDSYEWMEKYGDPLFHRHVAVSGIWGLLALRLADDPVLPFNYLSYAAQLQEHVSALEGILDGSLLLSPIKVSIKDLSIAAQAAIEEAKRLGEEANPDNILELKRRSLNDKLMLAERAFLDRDGLQGRQWFKHLIYGPPVDYESKMSFFPGVADAIYRATNMSKKEGQAVIQHEIWRVARAIGRAASALSGELT
ncbi:glutamate carboxypeptidase II [Ranunculus cassubicifolius]